MEKNETMTLYVTHYEVIKKLDELDQLKTLKAIIEYSFYGIEPEIDGIPEVIFSMARPNIDASNRRRKVGKENGLKGASHGAKGGRPKLGNNEEKTPIGVIEKTPLGVIKKPPYGFSENPHTGLKKTPNITLTLTETITETETETKTEIEKDYDPKSSSSFVAHAKNSSVVLSKPERVAEEKGSTGSGGRGRSFRSWTKNDLAAAVHPFVEKYGRDFCNEFFMYWSEPTASGKMRVNVEKAFDVARRLMTWQRVASSSKRFASAAAVSIPVPKFKSKASAEQWVIDTYYQGRRELSALGMGISLTDGNDQPRPIEDIRLDVENHMTSYQQ